jgi:hypothetical protein
MTSDLAVPVTDGQGAWTAVTRVRASTRSCLRRTRIARPSGIASPRTRVRRGNAGYLAMNSAATRSARGSSPQLPTNSRAADGSASTRSPISACIRRIASASDSTSTDRRWAPSSATKLLSGQRLVTRTRHRSVAGNSDRTCWLRQALSTNMSMRRSATRLRNNADCSASRAGMAWSAIPSARRHPGSTGSSAHPESLSSPRCT